MRCNLVKSVGEREREMTRDEAKQFLIDSGVAEPTDDAVSNLLNTIHASVKSAEDRANKYKEDSLRAKDLAKELDEIKSANLTDLEKANKATEDAMAEVETLKKTVKAMELSKSLAEIGIVGDDASQLINEDGSLNTVKLGEIISSREKSAVAGYQKKVLDETPSPSGGKPTEDDKDAEVKEFAQAFSDRAKAVTEAQDIVNSYV